MIPNPLQHHIEQLMNCQIVATRAIGGGDISQAVHLSLSDGQQVLLKWRARAVPTMFTTEAKGLTLMREAAHSLVVPQVFCAEEADGARPAFILMNWLGRANSSTGMGSALGQGLADMHRATNPTYGLDHDNFIGANPQPNNQHDNWVDFFHEERLGYQMELAGQKGHLNQQRKKQLDRLLVRLSDLLPLHPPISLLHGDLWGGNWLVTETGQPALIDPAVYYGDREAELAFTELFGGFPSDFYRAYNESWPLDTGYAERKSLYNLYHLLNHLNLFGEGYGGQVDSVLRRYA
ncbi:fructosamine kinase family protein [Anaerolineales bacterium HSG25]|nr:fructosamine kinase family protein [Anaerolineales bacterium HSG25]